MDLCALCILISRKNYVTEIPEWCKSHVNMNLSQINLQRLEGGGKVSKSTIVPQSRSKFSGKTITVSAPNFQVWNGMKRCDECIQGLINSGARVE
jgi:hypothetical protein